MADRPIIFNAPMVRAILREIDVPGTGKTQTRRLVKPQLVCSSHGRWPGSPDTRPVVDADGLHCGICGAGIELAHRRKSGVRGIPVRFSVGDVLWVRESWSQHHPAGVQEGRFSALGEAGIPGPPPLTYRVIYKVDGDPVRVWQCDEYPYRTTAGPSDELAARHPDVCSEMPGWVPSIHMPRKFSRLTLEVTGVKVERLQDISEADVDAEVFGGDFPHHVLPELFPEAHEAGSLSLPECFARVWDSIYASRGLGWVTNPWVVAVTFVPHAMNVDAFLAQKVTA